jgi:tungstate transport system substrate-binding protein
MISGRIALAFGIVMSMVVGAVSSAFALQDDTDPEERDVILATTTSTQDSGLLDILVPLFEERTGYALKPIAVGSGAAMQMGERGEADILLVHSPDDEREFMDAGYGVERRMVFYNDFVIVGPASDPAGVSGQPDLAGRMEAIATSEARFVSRGDDSGTHKLELRLWENASIEPSGSWYIESGTSMGETLRIANERDAYTISDRGTLLALGDTVSLEIVREGDADLLNVYHAITVHPDVSDTINVAGGEAFLTFLLDPEIQALIGEVGVEEFGQPLFFPCADNTCGVLPMATVEAGS